MGYELGLREDRRLSTDACQSLGVLQEVRNTDLLRPSGQCSKSVFKFRTVCVTGHCLLDYMGTLASHACMHAMPFFAAHNDPEIAYARYG